VVDLSLVLLVLNVLSIGFPNFIVKMSSVSANESVSHDWFYSGWQYRKEHNITYEGLSIVRFYDLSDLWVTISGNPTQRHAFQPVHNTTIIECNKVVDGALRKYLAYDSDAVGSQIRLYYTDNLDGQWTPYSGNPILSGYLQFRWPSVAYVNGVFHMFLTDRANGYLERWTSTDGISFTFQENVIVGGSEWKNPFIWFNPNDNKWYLYSHDASGGIESIKVRSAINIEDLDEASDTTVVSKSIPFGSPTVMFYDGKYWLLGEALEGSVWKVVAYYSTMSPFSGFVECVNSAVLSDDEACPMLFLNQEQNQAYLFTNKDSTAWYQVTYMVYLNSTTISAMPDLVEYQVRITTNYGNGIDNGENVYLNEHSKTDFSDVRFTWFNASSESEIECNYWIEDLNLGVQATFWVKIPKIQSRTDTTIYIYYGKDDAISTSNGLETFDFFDDFNGGLEKWTIISGTWKIENGELSAETTATPWGQRIRANGFTFGNHSVHVKIKWVSGTYFEHGPYVRGQQPNEPDNGYMTFLSTWDGDSKDRISKMSNGLETTIAGQGTTNPSKNVWYTFVFKLYGNILKSSITPLYPTEITATDKTFSSGTLCLFSWSATAEHAHYDDIFVCKYVYPEPSHGAWGTEEQAGAPPTPSISVSDISINTTIATKPCNFSAVFTAQNSYLSHYIFGTNNTGTWINDTAVSFGEGKTQAPASIIKTLNSTIETVIQWQIWANNTAGNWTTTGIQTLTTSGNQSTIATLTTYGYAAVEYACQRKTFYANGRFWVFYYDGASSAGYSTSTDGFSWTPFAPFTSRTCGAGWRFAVALDGTRLHYVFSTGTNGDPLYYRCGLPNADGTITWLDNEQNITIGESDTGHLWPSIAIDSEGRPWVAYARKNATENSRYAYVTTSITSNGTWITRVGFPHRLSSTNYTGINVMIVPLTNQKMLAIVSCAGWQIESYLWNGSSWSEKQTTSSAITSDGIIECGLSAVNQGDDVHLVFIKDSTHDLVYTKYSYASNSWGPETIVQPAVTSETSPVLSIDSATNMLYCFWAGAPTADCIYYKVYNGSAWSFVEGSNPWIIERNLAGYYRYDGLSGFYKSNNNLLGLAYTNGAYGVYQLKFAFLTTKARQYVIIDQALVSDERANVGSVQTVMFHAKWSNGSDVVHGSIYVNGTEYVTDNMGWITFEVTLPQIGKDEWGVTAVSCSGVIDYMQSAQNPSIIWDRVIILLSVSNNRIDTGATANIAKTAFYEYDSSPFIGTITLNDTATKTTVGRYGYKVSSISDPIYGLTSFTTNEVYCIFDRVTINTFTATDNRINVGDTANFVVSGVYEYDLAPWVGSYILNDTIAKPTVGKYGYKIAGITDSKYGLTAFKQTAPDVYVIFDRISVDSYGTDDARRDVNTEATFYLTLKYEYDDTLVADGFAYLNGSLPLTWSPISSRWELKTTSPIVQKLIVYLENVNGNAYGITALNPAVPTKKISVIWDRIQIVDGGTTKTTLTIGETAIVWFKAQYEYDGAVFTGANGTLYVNGTALTWSKTNSRWEYQYTAKKPGTAAFAISGVSDISQGLTAINDEVGTQTIIVRKRTR